MTASATVLIARDEDSQQILNDPQFQQQWQTLCQLCPWATPFQSSDFILTWFDCYQSTHVPILLLGVASDSHDSLENLAHDGYTAVEAIMFLALPVSAGSLQVAGTHHAEYQAWLERPDSGQYLPLFLAELAQLNDTAITRMKYVPAASPLSQVEKLDFVDLVSHPRPLWRLDSDSIAASLKKKSNKSKFNRLKRIGEFEFVTITDAEHFEKVLGDVVAYYDLRQGGANNSFPFLDDPLKKTFHVELMKRNPELFHVTAMLLDQRCVSIHIGIRNQDQVHLAIVAHAPQVSRHSPGKMHLLMLAEQLLSEHISVLDLTPGGDPWKERFATEHDTVHELVIYPNAAARAKAVASEKRLQAAKSMLAKVNVTPDHLKSLVASVRRISPGAIIDKVRSKAWLSTELRIYQQALSPTAKDVQEKAATAVNFGKDQLDDLLLFQPEESWQTRQLFAREALSRLEQGEHVYTVVQNGILVHYGWLIEKQNKAYFSEVEQSYDYPEPGAVFYDFYTSPSARGQGLYQRSIALMLDDAANKYDANGAYITCRADNGPSRHVIEKLGFIPQHSLHLKKRFGKVKKW